MINERTPDDLYVSKDVTKIRTRTDSITYTITYGDDVINFMTEEDIKFIHEKLGEFINDSK